MATTISKLGDCIRQVNLRNTAGSDNLYGLSMTKEFRKSTSNIIGVDLSKYKVVKDDQFACDFMSPIRVNKLPIVINKTGEEIIVSPAYPVFEVKDRNLVCPDYLMLWFRRSEFDRHVVFQCDGGVRGGYGWKELCNEPISMPDIDTQKRIVKKYECISKEIQRSKDLIIKVDLLGRNLFKSILQLPGHKKAYLTDIATFKNGAAMQKYECTQDTPNALPVLKIRELNQGHCDEKSNYAVNFPKDLLIKNGDLVFSWSGTLAVDLWAGGNAVLNQHLFLVNSEKYPKWLYYYWTREHLEDFIRIADGKKTSMGHIQRNDLKSAEVIIPNDEALRKYNRIFDSILDLITLEKQKILLLERVSSNIMRYQK